MRKYVLRLVFCILAVLIPFGIVLATDTSPQLGLDLQGGISVVLSPVEDVSDSAMTKAVDIIRNRVDALGVAEPEINRQGDNVIVDLPGVKNRNRARQLVGQTAELRFRPVIESLPPEGEEVTTTTTTAPGSTTTTAPGSTTTTTKETTSTTKQGGRVIEAQAGSTTTTSAPTTTTTAPEGGTTTTTIAPLTGKVKTTKVDDPNKEVVLPVRKDAQQYPGQRLRLGPAELLGKGVKSARADFDQGQWQVVVKFTGEGKDAFNKIAAKYFGQQVAIVLDGVVQSFPTIQAREFPRGEASITGAFTKGEAEDLETILRYGALPVALQEETFETISPTLGRDQLRAGIAAGLFGLGLVMIYMVLYYRMLGLVIWVGLVLAAGALYALTSWFSSSIDLTLTLAGVTGIIVSVGITVDSYVVYFERLKDEVRSGKTIRSSLDRGFSRSFRTILAADFVSLIGAGLLYMLAVGSVRGFAFFLGLSTVLDIFVAYFFMHPLVTIIARNPKFTRARWLGVASGLDAKGATA